MIMTCEIYLLQQIYNFLVERDGFNKLSPHNQVLAFFKEVNLGQPSDVIVVSPSIVSGKFGKVSQVNLSRAPFFNDKDKFIKWAHSQLNS